MTTAPMNATNTAAAAIAQALISAQSANNYDPAISVREANWVVENRDGVGGVVVMPGDSETVDETTGADGVTCDVTMAGDVIVALAPSGDGNARQARIDLVIGIAWPALDVLAKRWQSGGASLSEIKHTALKDAYETGQMVTQIIFRITWRFTRV